MRVLVVEDDKALGTFLQKGLSLEGHDVEWVGDGDAAVAAVLGQTPDLMVLDLTLPGRDGIEVLQTLAGRLDETAVLVLTGRSQVEERVRCLNLGADDCLLKPFSFHELSARCRAILRRCERPVESALSFAGLEMNLLNRQVRYLGTAVELTTREFNLLEFLVRRRGECCSRGDLLREVWRSSPEAGTNIVDVYITYLRRKLSVIAASNLFAVPADSIIETVRGSGYRIRPLRLQQSAPASDTLRASLPVVNHGIAALSAAGQSALAQLPNSMLAAQPNFDFEAFPLVRGA